MTESCRRVCSLCCDTSPRGQTSHPHAGHAKSSSLSARATSNVDDDDIDNRLLSSSLTCSTLPAHLYHFMMVWLVADNVGPLIPSGQRRSCLEAAKDQWQAYDPRLDPSVDDIGILFLTPKVLHRFHAHCQVV